MIRGKYLWHLYLLFVPNLLHFWERVYVHYIPVICKKLI